MLSICGTLEMKHLTKCAPVPSLTILAFCQLYMLACILKRAGRQLDALSLACCQYRLVHTFFYSQPYTYFLLQLRMYSMYKEYLQFCLINSTLQHSLFIWGYLKSTFYRPIHIFAIHIKHIHIHSLTGTPNSSVQIPVGLFTFSF